MEEKLKNIFTKDEISEFIDKKGDEIKDDLKKILDRQRISND